MPREPSDGWIKIRRGGAVASCVEADHSQPQEEGSLEEQCAKHVTDSKRVAEFRGSSGVIGSRGHQREGGVRSGVDTCQGTIETQTSSVHESPYCHRGSEVGHQVGEGSGSIREFFRGQGGLFAEGSRQGLRGSTGTPFGGSNQGAKLEADVVTMGAVAGSSTGSPQSRVAELEQQITAGAGARCIPSPWRKMCCQRMHKAI